MEIWKGVSAGASEEVCTPVASWEVDSLAVPLRLASLFFLASLSVAGDTSEVHSTSAGQCFSRAVGHSPSTPYCFVSRRLKTEASRGCLSPCPPVSLLGAGNGYMALNSYGSNWQIAGLTLGALGKPSLPAPQK